MSHSIQAPTATPVQNVAKDAACRRILHRDIEVRLDGTSLILANSRLQRTFDLSTVLPRTKGLLNPATGFEYAAADRADSDFTFMGYNLPHDDGVDTAFSITGFDAAICTGTSLMPEHVEVRLELRDAVQALELVRTYVLFPEQAFMISRAAVRCPVQPGIYWSRRGQHDLSHSGSIAEFNHASPDRRESVMDSVPLRVSPARLHTVEFFARTDYTNTLMRSHAADLSAEPVRLRGNLCFCCLAGDHGLFLLQEAPHSNERRDLELADFRYQGRMLSSLCWGIQPHEVRGDRYLWGYRHVLGLYQGDDVEAARAVKAYQAYRFADPTGRKHVVMVNPWGGGRFRSLISETFLREEIVATAEVGATHYQIDDGWEQGGSLSDITRSNRATDLDFWQVDRSLLPEGIVGLAGDAKQAGVELALWIAPNSSQEHRDWRPFADLLLDLHRTCGIRHFKFDGIMIRTKDAEDNLERLLDALHRESDGKVVIDFDVTNGQRPGFLLFQEYGILFLANRYVCHNWGKAYHPELVLRKLWQFAQYLRPQSVQIPVTDPGIINDDNYRRHEMETPDIYDPEYWAALTLFASPLLWLNPSRLKPEVRQAYRRIMDLHRRHREGIFAGEIFPVGPEPDGAALCGFQSHHFATGTGYLVVYRERRGPAEAKLPLHFTQAAPLRLTSLSDDAEDQNSPAASSTVTVQLDRPGSFRLYRYEPIKE